MNPDEWAQDHVAKHDALMTLFNSNSVPLDCDYVNYIENWFVQHVMNTGEQLMPIEAIH